MSTSLSTTVPDSTSWQLRGSADPEVVLAGHSHMMCMERALSLGLTPDGLRAAVAFASEETTGHQLADPSYWDFLTEASRGRVAAVVWNGNQHNASFLVQDEPQFRVWNDGPPAAADRTDTRMWVPREQVRALWAADDELLRQRLTRLSEGARQVLVIGTPPPKSDEFVARALRADAFFLEVAADLGLAPDETAMTPGPTRIALWTVVQDMLAASAADCRATFVPVPPEAVDEHGYLRGVLSTADATHANAAYGRLVWQAVARALGQSAAA
jgi:hypothetical protein